MKRWRHIGGWLLVILLLLVGAFWWLSNIRGHHEWKHAQTRAAELGVSLRLSDCSAPLLSDSESLLGDPVFAREWRADIDPRLNRWSSMEINVPNPRGIHGKRGELTDYLKAFPEETDPELAIAKLTEAAERIEGRLNPLAEAILLYPAQDLTPRHDTLLDSVGETREVVTLNGFVSSLRDQAILALHRREPDLALRNCEAIKRLAQNFSAPDLVHLLVEKSFDTTIQVIVTEGIGLQAWESTHLSRLANLLSPDMNPMRLVDALSFEAAFFPPSIADAKALRGKISDLMAEAFEMEPDGPPSLRDRFQDWIHFEGPRGWELSRKAIALNSILDHIETKDQWEWKRVEPIVVDMDEASEERFSFDPLAQFRDAGRTYSNTISKVFEDASRARLCHVVINIEKFRLANGYYPATLDDLPQGLPVTDPSDSQKRPLKYELLPEGGFQVYSLFFKEQYPQSRYDQLLWKFPKHD